MFTKETSHLLQKSLHDLPRVVCERDISRDIDDLVALEFSGRKLAVIADFNTKMVLGNLVGKALSGRYETRMISLEEGAAASDETVEYIRAQTRDCDMLVAVGSGTINDICKYAAHLDHRPYIVFPTAASMNGYLSANASITAGGYKMTVAAAMPRAVFCDLTVIAAAPARLARSGLGDSLARPTAQFDWLLSHSLLGTSYNEVPFQLLAPIEDALFDNARGVAMGDHASVCLLIQTLLLSGLGMTIAGGSYPASQGEHMVAHAMHMLLGAKLPDTYHGEEIGVTTLAMVHLQESLLRGRPRFAGFDFNRDFVAKYFGGHVAGEAVAAFKRKCELMEAAVITSSLWDDVCGRLEKIVIPSPKIQTVLSAAGAHSKPENLGWEEKDYKVAWSMARFLRDRFTALDLTL